jgi:GNAT superfamily N-acetyltransferase
MSFFDVPAGKIAAVVTSLQMFERPPPQPERGDLALTLERVERPELGWFRDIFRRVGEDWLWFSRLAMSDAELAADIHDPNVEVYVLKSGEIEAGLLELDFKRRQACELSFFGLSAPFVGTGAGRFMMNRALEIAWSRPIKRLWVHTCTFDRQSAVAFYVRSGFRPFRLHIEVADDPRLTGLAPRTAAPHVPLIEPTPRP